MTKTELKEMIRECLHEEGFPKKVIASTPGEVLSPKRAVVPKPIDVLSKKRRAEVRELADSLAKELEAREPHSIFSICEYHESNSMYSINNSQPTEAGVIGLISVSYPESDNWWNGNNDATFSPVAATIKNFVRTLNSTDICKERNLHFTPYTDLCSDTSLYFEVWNYGDYYDAFLSEEFNLSEERVWSCWFDGTEVGTVSAATSEEAKEKMMNKYPEYQYGLYDGCFWVEPEDNNIQECSFTDAAKGDENLEEAAAGFRLTGPALLSIEDLADAVYRDNDPDAIKKYASSKDIKDVAVDDLAIAAENSDLSREIKYLAAHLKNKGVATIGEFAATLAEALSEDVDTMDWDTLIDKADELLYELIKVSGNADYDDGDGYWSGEEGHIWTNRYLYCTAKLKNSTRLDKLCNEYSSKLPNVVFYYTEDDFLDDPVSEIGYEATNINY